MSFEKPNLGKRRGEQLSAAIAAGITRTDQAAEDRGDAAKKK